MLPVPWARTTAALTSISLSSWARVSRGSVNLWFCLSLDSVLGRDRGTDVPGADQGEDVRLKHLDERLQERHRDRDDEGEDPDRLQQPGARLDQQELPADGEDEQDEVAGEHRGEHPDRERDRVHEELQERLDR